jgi:UDP-4-amino-4,6-dideoxy-N-acetyl-beta-L-altrosamine N-acetyltransferase
MYTDHCIGVNEHLDWICRLKTDPKQMVFAVLDEDSKPLGGVSLNAIDQRNKKADWAYYLSQHARGGLGPALEYAFIEFVFHSLNIEKLNCEVIEGNDSVVKLHRKFLFQVEGFRRANIIKYDARTGVHFLGLTKEEWDSGKHAIYEKYESILSKFDISIDWPVSREAPDPHPIDQIEAARAKNNLNWMAILRLALEKSPTAASPIVAEITRLDRQISELTEKLVAKT